MTQRCTDSFQHGDGLKERQREGLADNAGDLQGQARVGRQPVEAREDDALHGAGNGQFDVRQRRRGAQAQAVVVAFQAAGGAQRGHGLGREPPRRPVVFETADVA